MSPKDLAKYIDHTLLKPETSPSAIERLCHEAMEHGFYSVCVNSIHVPLCRELLGSSPVQITSVVGFPLGAMSSEAKAFETKTAIAQGATEIDMVLSVGHLKAGGFATVAKDISAVVRAAGSIPVKVIIETALLTESEKVKACEISRDAKAAFVKTCTGFSGGQATVADVKLMRKAAGSSVQVKASGGIKTIEQARALIEAGASRLGTSSGLSLIGVSNQQGSY